MDRHPPTTRPSGFLAVAIVELTLTTAYIHLSLGGILFTVNAAGYAALAVAFIVIAVVRRPLVERFAWMPRVGLAGYTAATIAGYLVIGPFFSLGWVAKAIEVAILTLLVADVRHAYGTPSELVRSALASFGLRSAPRSASRTIARREPILVGWAPDLTLTAARPPTRASRASSTRATTAGRRRRAFPSSSTCPAQSSTS
jgi:hypothetical protein